MEYRKERREKMIKNKIKALQEEYDKKHENQAQISESTYVEIGL